MADINTNKAYAIFAIFAAIADKKKCTDEKCSESFLNHFTSVHFVPYS